MLRWPQDIPLVARQPVDPGRCFRFERANGTQASRFLRKPIRLSGSVFFLVSRGSIVLESTGQRLLLDEGSGCLVLPDDVRLTEVPDRVGRFWYHVLCFDDRTIKKAARNFPYAEALSTIMRPGFIGLYPINTASTRWLCSLLAAERLIPNGVPGILRLLLADVSVPAYLFLRRGYFAHRRAFDLWLEEHIISPENVHQIAARFPGGARRFFKDFKTYQELSPARWLRRRRMELASVWLRHGIHPSALVHKAVGYVGKRDFERDYKAERAIAVGQEARLHDGPGMKVTALLEIIRPFWLVDQTSWQRREQAREAEIEALRVNSGPDGCPKHASVPMPLKSAAEAPYLTDDPDQPSNPCIQEVAKQFWNLKTTAVDALIIRQQEANLYEGEVADIDQVPHRDAGHGK